MRSIASPVASMMSSVASTASRSAVKSAMAPAAASASHCGVAATLRHSSSVMPSSRSIPSRRSSCGSASAWTLRACASFASTSSSRRSRSPAICATGRALRRSRLGQLPGDTNLDGLALNARTSRGVLASPDRRVASGGTPIGNGTGADLALVASLMRAPPLSRQSVGDVGDRPVATCWSPSALRRSSQTGR